MTGGEAIHGIRMEYARFREPSGSQSESTLPGNRAFLASADLAIPSARLEAERIATPFS